MSKKINYYKQYALKCLLKRKTNSRSFDNCFEGEHSYDVVIYLMNKAIEPLPPLPKNFDFNDLSDEKLNRLARKHAIQMDLEDAIKEKGYWGSWLYTYVSNQFR